MTKARDIADGVDTADIADGAISTDKLADGSITSAKLDTNINISGDVGIGITSVDTALGTKLHVAGTIRTDTGSGGANPAIVFDHDNFADADANYIMLDRTSEDMRFNVNASEAMRIYSDGVVKIHGTLSIAEAIEKATIDNSTTGTINFDALTQAVIFYDTAQTANRTVNFRGDGSTTLDSIMAVGESMTFALLITQGGTAYYLNTYQVDGSSVTPKWSGGSAPSSGNANSVDVYTFTILKTASATFSVFAGQLQYA